MADENGTTETKKRPRKPPQRRGYKGEYDALQERYARLDGKVDMALRLLGKCLQSDANSPAAKELIAVAIETLSGE